MTQVAEADDKDRARVLTTATLRAAEALELTGKELGGVLGVSEPSVSCL